MKTIFTLILSFVLGLLFCDLVSAQIYQLPANPQLFQPAQTQHQQTYTPGLADRARQVLQPPQTYIPGLSEQARQTQLPGLPNQATRDLLRNIDLGSPSLQLPKPQQRPPQVLQFPPINPIFPGNPQPLPQPVPQPQGPPTFELGPNGPVINLDNGQSINIPVGQIVDRIRNRRPMQPRQPSRIFGQRR
jgi:hypothetical protein